MPTIDLGSVVGPQGEQGNTGPQGEQGIAGPSLISASTQTTLTGVLAGDGSTVGVRAVDATPTNNSTNLVSSGGVYTKITTDVANAYQRTCNPNLLDNWFFCGTGGDGYPINQRGTLSYTRGNGDTTCTIDRWHFNYLGGSVSLAQSGMTVTPNGSGNFSSSYSADYTNALLGKKVTLSALVGGVLYQGTGILPSSVPVSSTTYVDVAMSTGYVRALISSGGNLVVGFGFGSNPTMVLQAVKLELGDTQTLAHQENNLWVLNEIPNYAEELAKCQRYLLVLTAQNNLPVVGNGVAISGTQGIISVPTPVTMRKATPTVSNTGTIVLNHGATFGSAAPAISSISGPSLSENVVSFGANVASGLTNGEVCGLQLRDSSAIITISCEI